MRHARALGRTLALACAAAAAWGASGAACSNASGGASGGAVDAASDQSIGSVDAGGGVSLYPDAAPLPTVVPPRVYVVNASADAPPLRFCLGFGAPGDGGSSLVAGGLGATPDSLVAGFPIAGVYPGFAAPFADHGLDLDTLTLDVFALDATNAAVASNTSRGGPDGGLAASCESLIGSDALGASTDAGGVLRPGVDYWYLGTLPMGALGHGTSWLVAVTGCVPGETRAPTLCPTSYEAATGDLALVAWQLDDATQIAANAVGVQFAQASSAWDNFARATSGTTSAGFLVPTDAGMSETGGPDAGAGDAASGAGADAAMLDASSPATPWAGFVPIVVADDAGFGSLQPAKLVPVEGALGASSAFYAQITDPLGNAVAPSPVGWLLPDVQAFTWPGGAPEAGTLRAGAGFVFVLLGDPAVAPGYVNPVDGGPASAEAGLPNGHAAHFLALPVANP